MTDPDDEPTRADAASGEAGPSIGPYRLLQKIGEGGMGEVWLAEQTEQIRNSVRPGKAGRRESEVAMSP